MRQFLTVMFVTWAALATNGLSAQDSAKSEAATRKLIGIGACRNCHRSGSLPKATDPDLDPFERAALGSTSGAVDDSWVKLDEYKTWLAEDKHAQAYTSLLNDRSKRMGELLGVDVSRDKRCLACHSGFPLSALGEDKNQITEEMAKDPRVFTGVSCEGCHGPADNSKTADGTEVKGWLSPHIAKDSWRFLSPNDKLKNFGFINVRSVTARTRLCVSCHLGSASEGRFVTHEMYAAGHPPLPGFELASFTEQLPKHWRYFDEKDPKIREQYLEKNEPSGDIYGKATYKVDNLHQTNSVLIAALVSFSENVKLSAALANPDVTTPVAKPNWPELSQFECYSCHHDLQDKSWRQRRALHGAPGRPLMRGWPIPLTVIAVKRAGGDEKKFQELWSPVEKLLDAQPFGHRDQWKKAAGPLTTWLDELAVALERKPLQREEGLALLESIATVGEGKLWSAKEAELELWDYDTARQLVWAAKVLQRELSSDRSPKPILDRVNSIQAGLADVEQAFILDLLKGKKGQQVLPGGVKGKEVQEADLETTLKPIAKYNAIEFREKCHVLAGKLAAK
jgi:hypothetical protein